MHLQLNRCVTDKGHVTRLSEKLQLWFVDSVCLFFIYFLFFVHTESFVPAKIQHPINCAPGYKSLSRENFRLWLNVLQLQGAWLDFFISPSSEEEISWGLIHFRYTPLTDSPRPLWTKKFFWYCPTSSLSFSLSLSLPTWFFVPLYLYLHLQSGVETRDMTRNFWDLAIASPGCPRCVMRFLYVRYL